LTRLGRRPKKIVQRSNVVVHIAEREIWNILPVTRP
jgi:hypothetical protein